jgi:hypothetical protein
MKTKLFISVLFCTFCFSNLCFANPIATFPSLGGTFALSTWKALTIDCAADFTALATAYLVIRKSRTIVSLVFLPYFGLVFIGGIIIDIVSIIPANLATSIIPELYSLWIFLSAGLLLYFYNGFLSKKFIKIETNQARVVGVVMGILTNPLIGSLVFSSIQVWQ